MVSTLNPSIQEASKLHECIEVPNMDDPIEVKIEVEDEDVEQEEEEGTDQKDGMPASASASKTCVFSTLTKQETPVVEKVPIVQKALRVVKAPAKMRIGADDAKSPRTIGHSAGSCSKPKEDGIPPKKCPATAAAKKAAPQTAFDSNLYDRIQYAEMDLYVVWLTYSAQFPDAAEPFNYVLNDIPDSLNLLHLDLSSYITALDKIFERSLCMSLSPETPCSQFLRYKEESFQCELVLWTTGRCNASENLHQIIVLEKAFPIIQLSSQKVEI
ncbi:hypothetical protein BC629DRAFT_1443364 [Irpex lacteus]|nr:hypothetical protein BC629DRAFT_1443364 [Irpex lacteus]